MNAISPKPVLATASSPRLRTTEWLGPHGHVSFGWEEQNDEWILPMIKQKMAEGYVFWIVERNNFANMGVFEHEVQIKDIGEIGKLRRVLMHDDDARKLMETGKIKLTKEFGESDYKAVKRADTAEEVVGKSSIAHRRAQGG